MNIEKKSNIKHAFINKIDIVLNTLSTKESCIHHQDLSTFWQWD